GMGISDAEYDAVTEDMVAALDARHIPKEAQRRFLVIRDARRADIVEAPATGHPVSEGQESVMRRAEELRDTGRLLELADNARQQGNASLASRLFSSAELVLGGDLLAELRPLFPLAQKLQRARTPPQQLDVTAAPQPRSAGGSDDEARASEPARASVSGTL